MEETDYNLPEIHGDWTEKAQSLYYRFKTYFKRFWWIVILVVSLSLSYQFWKKYNHVPTYRSVGMLKVQGKVTVPEGDVYREQLLGFFQTEIETIKSQSILSRAESAVKALHPELIPSPTQINAFQKPDTVIFEIVASGSEPRYTQAFLNSVINEYLSNRKEERYQTIRKSMLAITDQVSEMESELIAIEDKIVDFRKSHNIDSLYESRYSTDGKFNHTERSYSYVGKLKTQLAELKIKKRLLENLDVEDRLATEQEFNSEDSLHLKVMEISENFTRTKFEYDEAIAQMEEFSRYLKNKHPKMMQFNRTISRLGERLDILKKQAIEQISIERKALNLSIIQLEAALHEAEAASLEESGKLAEYERMTSSLERKKQLFEKMLERSQAIELNIDLDQETITIYQEASKAIPERFDMAKSMVSGLTIGTVAGCFLVFLLGSFDRRVLSTEDIKENFDEPVLGIVPKERSFENTNLSTLHNIDSKHIFAEAFRTIRSSLLFMEQVEPRPNTYIVTSAVPEEGKSTIASNLAITLAQASSRTLLLDADLRRGRLNRMFNVPSKNGLSDVLQGKITLEDSIQDTAIENLHFIPRGESIENTAEFLIGDKMHEVLRRIKEMYDFIIIDAAPILATDDTLSFASKADSVLYIARSNMIRLRQVRVSLDNLKMRGANITGFIMNFADTKGMDYYYYNKYQYYYRYYSNNETST